MERITKFVYRSSFFLFLIIFSISFTECSDKCEETYRFVYYEPYYATSAEIKAAVALEAPQPLSDIGRIYFKDGILFINESGKGIHVIDNSVPSHPIPLSFLKIPGNYDLAIRGTILYADSYVDLVAFDISDLTKIKEVNRIERLFNNYTTMGMMVASDKGILTEWKKAERVTVNETECNAIYQPWGGIFFDSGIAIRADMAGLFNAKTAFAPTGGASQTGIGGSMARFTINGDFLYGLDGSNLDVVDVSVQTQPLAKNEISLSWDVETLFPYNNNLFVGSRTGMYILDLKTPTSPIILSQYAHVRSCDPVVVQDNYAYVTLRSGSVCEGFTNQLEVIDITNLKAPAIVKTYPMTNPHGLGIDQGTLFICDGADGLKAYDASNVLTISENQLAHYKNINAFDVIPYQHIAMVIGKDGLFQYDYSDINNIKLISQLPIVNP
jgi:hypothetical protein